MNSTALASAPAPAPAHATPQARAAETPDVLVIGGGPAGCAAATWLAQQGWQVTLLEKDRHRRFHIGESLLPMNIPILQRLGVLEQVRAIGVLKYAYECTRMSGPRWLMLGEAYAFVDPMFSSGVYLARHSAERGAAMVDAALRDPASEARLQRGLEKHLRRGLSEFKWFIYRFTSPTMRALFAQPRNGLQVEQAVVAMLAGAVFDNRAVPRRLRVFRAIYAMSAAAMLPRAWQSWRQRRRQAREQFHGDTLHGDKS